MPARGALREHQFPIDHDVEDASGTGNQLGLDAGKGGLQFSHQTGGSGFVVSNDAVVDRGAHGILALEREVPSNWADNANRKQS